MQAYYADYASEVERRKDEMRHAERQRLARSVSKRESVVASTGKNLLALLGGLMVSWGYHLQGRYADA
jgi:hypothetical protein